MGRKTKNTLPMEEFFKETGLNLKVVPIKKRNMFLQFILCNIGIIFIAIIMGLFASIPFLLTSIASIPVASAAIETWEDFPSEIDEIQIAEINTLYDINGNIFAEIWSENRIELENIDEISNYAIDALVSTEDKRFYEHGGIDIIGTLRAAITRSGGGSGITQQTIKNLRFYNQAGVEDKEEVIESSLRRKLEELKLALAYEEAYSKDEILLTYFNTVAMGAPNIYGIEAASNYFFGKKSIDLSLAEASALVGTVQNPVYYDMRNAENFDAWKSRQKDVLNRMVAEGVITQSESAEAFDTELELLMVDEYSGNCSSSSNPNYCNYVMDTLRNSSRLGDTLEERESIISKGGLNIYTYYDPEETTLVNNIVQSDFGNTNRVIAPVAVVEPGTGGVRALGMNRTYGEGEGQTTLNFPALPTGTGSTYKMIVLAAALVNGFTESDLTFSSECPLYPGNNYDYPAGGFKNSVSCALQGGKMDYTRATAVSSNTWFITLEKMIGVEAVKEFSRSVGLSAPDYITSRSLAYAIGTTENTPINMAAAFATFANNGIFCPATPIINYEYSDGSKPRIPDNYDPSSTACKRVMSSADAAVVLKAMRANTSTTPYPDAFGRKNYIPGDLAVGKSGTNELYNSAWVQVSSNYSLFIDIYDPVNINNLIEWVYHRGEITNWIDNAASITGGDIMRALIKHNPPAALNFNSKDNSFEQTPFDLSDFYIVPSVLGMKPEVALEILENMGIKTSILREKIAPTSMFPSGVVIKQSLEEGTRIASGTKKEMILTISE